METNSTPSIVGNNQKKETAPLKPYPIGAIYLVNIFFGPLASGIIGYKSLVALQLPKTAKLVLRASIIFYFIAIIGGYYGASSLMGVKSKHILSLK